MQVTIGPRIRIRLPLKDLHNRPDVVLSRREGIACDCYVHRTLPLLYMRETLQGV